MLRLARAAALAALAGVGGAAAQGEDPAALMAQLEARVLAAPRVRIDADIEARGLVNASLKGHSEMLERNRATLAFSGQFDGRDAVLGLSADGRLLKLNAGDKKKNEWVSPESNRALLVGLLRMGLLHNVARLRELQGPDHAQAGVAQWVVLDGFTPTTYAQVGELAGMPSFGFEVLVDGGLAGRGRLWLDPDTGLPRRRQLTVRFTQGEMTVVEDYRRFEIETGVARAD